MSRKVGFELKKTYGAAESGTSELEQITGDWGASSDDEADSPAETFANFREDQLVPHGVVSVDLSRKKGMEGVFESAHHCTLGLVKKNDSGKGPIRFMSLGSSIRTFQKNTADGTTKRL